MTDKESSKRRCPECSGTRIYHTRTGGNGGYGPRLLQGLGRLFQPAKLDIYMCEECGHMSFFADEDARGNVSGTFRWKKVK